MKVFVIGSPRSGTNLLRVMIGQLPQVANPHPPQVIHRLMHFIDFYQDNFKLMLEDACRILELNFKPWPFDVNSTEVLHRCDSQYDRHLFAISAVFHDLYAEYEGKSGWVNKGMFNIFYAEAIAEYFPDAKFIYLHRDGRDVGLSMNKAVFGDFLYYFIAKHWDFVQQHGLSFIKKFPNRSYQLSYENLIADPENSCRDLCNFLEVDYSPQMLEYHQSNEAKESANASAVLSNLSRPVNSKNTDKFLREMKLEDLTIFENIAGKSLDGLNYERNIVSKEQELSFTQKQIDEFRLKNDALIDSAWRNYEGRDCKARLELNTFLIEIGQRFGMDISGSIHNYFIAPSWYNPYTIENRVTHEDKSYV